MVVTFTPSCRGVSSAQRSVVRAGEAAKEVRAGLAALEAVARATQAAGIFVENVRGLRIHHAEHHAELSWHHHGTPHYIAELNTFLTEQLNTFLNTCS